MLLFLHIAWYFLFPAHASAPQWSNDNLSNFAEDCKPLLLLSFSLLNTQLWEILGDFQRCLAVFRTFLEKYRKKPRKPYNHCET